MRRLTLASFLMLSLVARPVGPAGSDEILFLNGDRLSGKILTASGGKLTIRTEGAGEVTVDLTKVKTFSTDELVRVGIGEESPVSSRVSAAPDGQVQASPAAGAPPQPLAIADIRTINSPPPAWTGSIVLNGLVTTGNSETEQLGFRAGLGKRWPSDRLTFGAEYYFGRQEDPDTGKDINCGWRQAPASAISGSRWPHLQPLHRSRSGLGLRELQEDRDA